jgi:hypothetical protein
VSFEFKIRSFDSFGKDQGVSFVNLSNDNGGYIRLFHNGIGGEFFFKNVLDPMVMIIRCNFIDGQMFLLFRDNFSSVYLFQDSSPRNLRGFTSRIQKKFIQSVII